MTIFNKILNWMTKNRNMLFLAVCLFIHATYLFVFQNLKIWPLAFLNLISCSFYIHMLFIKRDMTEKGILPAYFEILQFSFLSELAIGPSYGFALYMIGMAAAVFYLLPSYGNKRFLFQVTGIIGVIAIKGIVVSAGVSFPELREPAEPYHAIFYMANLGITVTIVIAATIFYSKEIDAALTTLNHNMNHDVLTGLYNRRYFEQQMDMIPEEKQCQYIISMVDIDDFKKVNDTYGHEAGDEVLIKVSSCLKEATGKESMAVRWGGEEFILYFPETTIDQIHVVMEEVRAKIESAVIRACGKDIRVTITVGIAIGLAGSNYEKVIRSADEKLYLGKQRGKNRIIT